jgi:hypothetical protein
MNERLVFLGQKAGLTLLRLADATLTVRLPGEWKLEKQLPQGDEFRRQGWQRSSST